jgi:aspartate racemase
MGFVSNESSLLVGVLGGMGPEATVDFMARVISLTPGQNDQDHVRLLVDQNPRIPNRQDALLRNGESPAPALADMARRLEAYGCDFLVMPCNTAHAFLDNIRAAVRIPFISIVDATLDAASNESCIGLLATAGCLDVNVYQPALESRGLSFVLPTDQEVEALTSAAFEIKGGNKNSDVSDVVIRATQSLIARGASAIIVACTELPLVMQQSDVDVPLLSSTDELARRAISIAFGDAPLP